MFRKSITIGSLLFASGRGASFSILANGLTYPGMMRAVVAIEGAAVVTSRPIPTLKSGEVLVKVAYSAINRADTLQRKGLYPPPLGETDVLGLELTGEVVAVGPGFTEGASIGSRVMVSVAFFYNELRMYIAQVV